MCYCNPGCECDCKRKQAEPKPVPHKHAALIKAWADGAKIQRRLHPEDEWIDTGQPNWSSVVAYRIKPEPTPDIVRYICALPSGCSRTSEAKYHSDNVKFIFDGETCALKSVELIK